MRQPGRVSENRTSELLPYFVHEGPNQRNRVDDQARKPEHESEQNPGAARRTAKSDRTNAHGYSGRKVCRPVPDRPDQKKSED